MEKRGARVSTDVFVRDLVDSQLAIDTIVVSLLHRDGRAKRGSAASDGVALREARQESADVSRARKGQGVGPLRCSGRRGRELAVERHFFVLGISGPGSRSPRPRCFVGTGALERT